MKTPKRIPAKASDGVWLRTAPLVWSRLPVDGKGLLLGRLGGGRAVCARNSSEVLEVAHEPPIEVVAELWLWDKEGQLAGCVDGCWMPLRYRGRRTCGIQLAAQVLTCGDRELLRKLIVHEYLHCLEMPERLIRG